ncbi:MAG: ATP-binding protein [Archaeoglobaceae archaeon]|nr:ATP-binding protein [Archaeoglobaceae archaeon]MCX8151529.1 ATP-binding protein [Archaeoglobaceae archaeon]MDW8013235.1 ATP-binding protein [Archaeoglobaceae archaeon]
MEVGIVIGRSSISEFNFVVNPAKVPKFGEYVVAKNSEGLEVLGIVREVSSFNRLILDGLFNFDYILKNVDQSRTLIEKNETIVATANVVGLIDEYNIKPNRSPIKPSTIVYEADSQKLAKILQPSSKGVEIGRLIVREDVPVVLDVNQLLLRHFAILSITGGGKSNAVSVIVNDIVRKLNGTVILIDPHGEYLHYVFEDGKEIGKNVVSAGIRCENLEPWEFASLIGISREAYVQRMHAERAFTTARIEKYSGKSFVEKVMDKIEDWINVVSSKNKKEIEYYDVNGVKRVATLSRNDLDALSRIKEYVSTFLARYEEVLQQKDMLASIKAGYLNVLNLSGFDEMQMRVVVSYLLRNILTGRINCVRGKREWEKICPAVKRPLMIIFEEAHIFATKDDDDLSRWMSRIAREGRKFGIGIGIVSQRPKKINDDILSQCNTKIILRVLEPNDQKYIQQASETISEDLLRDISSLGVGEAVIVGPAVKMPVAVKVRKFTGHYGGKDIDVVREWREEEIKLEDIAV